VFLPKVTTIKWYQDNSHLRDDAMAKFDAELKDLNKDFDDLDFGDKIRSEQMKKDSKQKEKNQKQSIIDQKESEQVIKAGEMSHAMFMSCVSLDTYYREDEFFRLLNRGINPLNQYETKAKEIKVLEPQRQTSDIEMAIIDIELTSLNKHLDDWNIDLTNFEVDMNTLDTTWDRMIDLVDELKSVCN